MLMGKRAKLAQQLLRSLYSQPITSANAIAGKLEITHQSASSLIRAFEDAKILGEVTGYKRNRLFLFKKYVDIFDNSPKSK